jgi:hypothetical protein
MRTTFSLIALLLAFPKLSAQSDNTHSPYELLGSVSYNYSNTKSQWTGESYYFNYETHAVTFQPSGGYFVTDDIELLVDLRYVFSSIYDNWFGVTRKTTDHTIGFNVGASYNLQVNPFLSAFVGSKVGLSWWRGGLFEGTYIDDPGWSKRQVSFPIFLIGSRLQLTRDWSILMLVQYSNTNLYYPIPSWHRNDEEVSFGFGFSVFL